MKKRNRQVTIMAFAISCAILLAGCGKASNGSYAAGAAADTAAAAPAYNSYATDDIYAGTVEIAEEKMADMEEDAGESGEVQVKDTSRKLIRNVDLSVETEEFDVLMQTITDRVDKLGGYVESSNTYNGSYYYGNNNRNANLTLRIPAESLDEFLSAVAEISNVISRSENVTDVTLQYVDMKSHKEALETEQKRLLELLDQAESVEDIITIESRLSEVRYQIESMESQLRTMDNQVSYSTVYLYIEEVTRLTPVKEQSAWEKIKTGFGESLYNIGNGIKNFFIGLIIRLPYLAAWAVVIVIVLIIIKLFRKHLRKKTTVKNERQKEEK